MPLTVKCRDCLPARSRDRWLDDSAQDAETMGAPDEVLVTMGSREPSTCRRRYSISEDQVRSTIQRLKSTSKRAGWMILTALTPT
jgi:hypothetical protein